MKYLQFPFEVKAAAEDSDFFTFEGMASTFNNVDLTDDIVMKGAFLKSLAVRMPVVLWQHNTNEPIGMPTEIRETDQGLFIKAQLPKADDLVRGRVIPQMKIGSIRKMSIGYSVKDSDIKGAVRMLKELDLFEVSLVTFPANPLAGVSAFKNADGKAFNLEEVQHINDVKSLREFLKESELFTIRAREHIINKFLNLRDASKNDGVSDSRLLAETLAEFKKLNSTLK